MDLKKGIMIKSKFGTKSAGNYILRYTSRESAMEPLEVDQYVTQYMTRYSAVQGLRASVPTENELWRRDEDLVRKDGVLFGNRGISYTDAMLKDAARVTQNASDNGHTVILPIVSFSHEYLQKSGIVDRDMPEVKEKGGYKGKVDQLKLRSAVTDMMDTMSDEMGFTVPEWTGSVHLDTTHVHVHLTMVETNERTDKGYKEVEAKREVRRPSMDWNDSDRVSPYDTYVEGGRTYYSREGRVIASQSVTKKGNPKFYRTQEPAGYKERVETGKIDQRTLRQMRTTFDRSLDHKKHLKPLVRDITDRRQFTRDMTKQAVTYDNATVEKFQALFIALPDDKKAWRAGSNREDMQRAHEICDDIINDVWTKYRGQVGLNDFNHAVTLYMKVKQEEEELDEEETEKLRVNAYSRLRTETMNTIYNDLKQIPDKDKDVRLPRQSVKGASTDALKNEIADSFTRTPEPFDRLVQMEYRSRSYDERFRSAVYHAQRFSSDIRKFDTAKRKGYASSDADVVREYYESEYQYNKRVADKYGYFRQGRTDVISDERFEEVRGVDLVNMLYDYDRSTDRTVPRLIAERYKEQTDARVEAFDKTLDYLVRTGQTAEYERMKQDKAHLEREQMIAAGIHTTLRLPKPEKVSGEMVETKHTVNTVTGRRLIKEELREIEAVTHEMERRYRPSLHQSRGKKGDDIESVDWREVAPDDNASETHALEVEQWSRQKLMFDQYLMEKRRLEAEREIEEMLEAREAEARQVQEDAERARQDKERQETSRPYLSPKEM